MICHLFLENQSQAGTLHKTCHLTMGGFTLSSWEWLQTYHDRVVLNHDKETLHCSQSCVPMHTCSHMQINVAHQNTLWVEALLCWVLITAASSCSQLVPGHTQPSQDRLCYTNPAQGIAVCARPEPSTAPLGAAHRGSGSDWQKEAEEHWVLPRDCSHGVPDPGNTPAVSCSSLELKQALFTLTTALKGKIQVDFEVVEFTHQFGFLRVCGIELWASE